MGGEERPVSPGELDLFDEMGEKSFEGLTLEIWKRLINEVRRLHKMIGADAPPASDHCACQGLYKPIDCPVHGKTT